MTRARAILATVLTIASGAVASAQDLPVCGFGFDIDHQSSAFQSMLVDGEHKSGFWLSINRAPEEVRELARYVGRLQVCLSTPDGKPRTLVINGTAITRDSPFIANCTATLLPGNRLLTNRHCYYSPELTQAGFSIVTEARINFGYTSKDDTGGVRTYRVVPREIAVEEDLDAMLLQVIGDPVADIGGHMPLRMATDIRPRQQLLMIHHPGAAPLQYSTGTCQVHRRQTEITPDRSPFRHTCESMGGSSGSLIFDARSLSVMALHNQGGLRPTGDSHNGGHKIAMVSAALGLGFEEAAVSPAVPAPDEETRARAALFDAMLEPDIAARIDLLRALIPEFAGTEAAARATVALERLVDTQEAERLRAEEDARRQAEAEAEAGARAAEAERLASARQNRCTELSAQVRSEGGCAGWNEFLATCGALPAFAQVIADDPQQCVATQNADRAEADRRRAEVEAARLRAEEEVRRLADEARRKAEVEAASRVEETTLFLGADRETWHRARAAATSPWRPYYPPAVEDLILELDIAARKQLPPDFEDVAGVEKDRWLRQVGRALSLVADRAGARADELKADPPPDPDLARRCYAIVNVSLARKDCSRWEQYGQLCGDLPRDRALFDRDPLACLGPPVEEPPFDERVADSTAVRVCRSSVASFEQSVAELGLPHSKEVSFDSAKVGEAVSNCAKALTIFPQQPRLKLLLAKAYLAGGNSDGALRHLRTAAEAGDTEAQAWIGMILHRGVGVPKDYREALYWLYPAAQSGQAHAEFELGLMYETGAGISRETGRALDYYTSASSKDIPAAAYHQALLLEDALGSNEFAAAAHVTALQLGYTAALFRSAGDWDPETARQLQLLLRERGLYSGTIDGQIGPASLAAMRALIP